MDHDQSILEELYHQHFNKTYRTAYLVTGDCQLAEDAAQEAFLRAFTNLHQLKNIKKFGPWVNAIASNYAIDLLRKNKKIIFSENTEIVADNDTQRSPHQAWERKEISQEIKKALWQLKAQERQILILKYYNELSIKEIANLTKTSPGTIKSRLFRARKKIGAFLQPKTGGRRLLEKTPPDFKQRV